MNRRTRTLIVLAVAISLASVAAFGVYRAIRNIPVRYVAIATKYAVVARETVPVGAMLTKEQVMLVAWPADAPVPGGFEKVEDVVGRGVISPLVPNYSLRAAQATVPVLTTSLDFAATLNLPPLSRSLRS
jgi:Flp pilus assembly protein CpaB